MYNTVILQHTVTVCFSKKNLLFILCVLLNPVNIVRYCAFIFKICNSFLKIKLFHYGLGDRTLDALAKFLEDGGLTEQPPKKDGKKDEEDVVVEVEDEVVEVEDEDEPPKPKDEL
jgi:hypothetical protein